MIRMVRRRGEHDPPRLLVSVRDEVEALAALAGGADVIDVKEPNRGSLGAADASTLAAVVRAVGRRAPVTAAAGELHELDPSAIIEPVPPDVALFKLGLAGCRSMADWPARWRAAIAALSADAEAGGTRAVAVAYADWQSADAPRPERVLGEAVELGCPALLVDTRDKSAGRLFDHWPADHVAQFVKKARSDGLIVVLAGSLAGESITAAARLGPDLVAVRAAACEGGRGGSVSSSRVRALRERLAIGSFPPSAAAAQDFS